MNGAQLLALLEQLNGQAQSLAQQTAQVLANAREMGQPAPARVLFGSPVTGQIEPAVTPWGGDWFDATGFAVRYTATGTPAFHTGADLNRPNYADSGAPVYAAADGLVVFNGIVPGWQGEVVVVGHTLEDGSKVWTRYAHIIRVSTFKSEVKRGEVIGTIADYAPKGPSGDHLHFDVARIDLGAKPGDWPGLDIERLKRDYLEPAVWIRERGR